MSQVKTAPEGQREALGKGSAIKHAAGHTIHTDAPGAFQNTPHLSLPRAFLREPAVL